MFICHYYMRKQKYERYESYENRLKQMKDKCASYQRYVNRKAKNNVETNEDSDDSVDRSDSEVLYLKNCTNLYRRIDDDDDLTDYHEEIKSFIKEYFNIDNVIVYPRSVNIMKECLRMCRNNQIYCDEYICKRLKSYLNEIDADVTYYAHDDLADFKKKIEVNNDDDDKSKFVYFERICERTGQMIRDLNTFIQIATDNNVNVILKEALHVQLDDVNDNDTILIIYDTTYLFQYINGFALGPMNLLERIQPNVPYTVQLTRNSFEEVRNFKKLANDLIMLAKRVHQLLKLKHLEIVSEEDSYIKVLRIDIASTRENYNKTLRDFCKAKSIYLEMNDSGVVLHLYSHLYKNEVKLNYLKKVFCQGLVFCLEKENVAATL